jgi:hypothetical protein
MATIHKANEGVCAVVRRRWTRQKGCNQQWLFSTSQMPRMTGLAFDSIWLGRMLPIDRPWILLSRCSSPMLCLSSRDVSGAFGRRTAAIGASRGPQWDDRS